MFVLVSVRSVGLSLCHTAACTFMRASVEVCVRPCTGPPMWTWLYACKCLHVHTSSPAHIHLCAHSSLLTSTHAHIHSCTNPPMCTSMYTSIHTHVHPCTHPLMHASTRAHIHPWICPPTHALRTHARIHLHTYTCALYSCIHPPMLTSAHAPIHTSTPCQGVLPFWRSLWCEQGLHMRQKWMWHHEQTFSALYWWRANQHGCTLRYLNSKQNNNNNKKLNILPMHKYGLKNHTMPAIGNTCVTATFPGQLGSLLGSPLRVCYCNVQTCLLVWFGHILYTRISAYEI